MPFYLFYQMGSFGNFMFLAVNYLSLIRVDLNQPDSNGTGLNRA